MNSAKCVFSAWIALCFLISPPTEADELPTVEIRLPAGQVARAADPIEFTAIISVERAEAESAPQGEGTSPPANADVMSIMEISVAPSGLLASDYASTAECQFEQQGLRRDRAIEVPCILYPKSSGIADKLFPSATAVFAKTIILRAHLKYMKDDSENERLFVTRVEVVPPIVAVFYGGMVGALLLAIFRGLAPFRHGLSHKPPTLPASGREMRDLVLVKGILVSRALMVTVAWLVLGGISAIMIIILAKASGGDLSPVQVDVKDFLGGVLVGLLSFPVVNWLESRLVASEIRNPPPGPATPPAAP